MIRINPGDHFVEFSQDETHQSINERFEKQVLRNPTHIAIQTDRLRLTYDDINKAANRVARALLQQYSADTPVAILMEHDAPAVIAMVGALKASRIFIPLNPLFPDARIAHILNNSGADLIVTNDSGLRTELELFQDRRIVNLDHLDPDLSSDNVDLRIPPATTSYILYTSGSTGEPKGVIRTHRNDLQNIRNRTNSFCITDEDRLTLLGSYSTGQGMTDIESALLNGATLLLRDIKADGYNPLAEWLIHEKITIYHSSTTLFRRFIADLNAGVTFTELRIVNIGGEPVTWKDVELYKKHSPENCILANELSCSEASTFAQFFLNKQTRISVTVPVGYPVEDKGILILDDNGDQLGPGKIGQIVICSEFLSPGYWRQPDLTKLAYSPLPESQSLRIYQSGDLGRVSDDGCLEYLGRKDARVKIRGYRVECYEVELALIQDPEVDQAFVTHCQDTRDETFLIAYIVLVKGALRTVSELRTALTAHLPEYMVPSAFVFLEFLPLTPAGKIDRGALPQPDSARPALDVRFVAPSNPIQKAVATLCSEILRISTIGINDNLFDLGGNSLSAMQILARVMKNFRVNVPLRLFYESPTIAGLSERIADSTEDAGTLDDAALITRDLPIPLSYYQERLWFMEEWEPANGTFNLSHAYHLKGCLNEQVMEESLDAVIQRHEILRTSFIAHEGQPVQVIEPVLRVAFDVVDLRTLPEADRTATSLRSAQDAARRPFDLALVPLLRALLVKLADEEHLFVLIVHQIVCDGWSLRVLLSEFWTLYQAQCRGGLPVLPTPSVQYRNFAIWQRQLWSEKRSESQLSFWKETLHGSLPVLDLPTDYARPRIQSFAGGRVPLEFPKSITAGLHELSRREGVTLFMTLLAAFKTLLYRYSGQEDLIVGFPVADRFWREATNSIGFFVNTLVARTKVSGELTFRDFLLRVRDRCLEAYAHQDVPFEKLVEVMRPSRDLSRSPVFQAMFTFQNMPAAQSPPPELSARPITIDNGTCKVDLTLSLTDRDGRLIGFLEYCADLFDRATIERMAGHLRMLVSAIIDDCTQSIAKLPLLSSSERREILIDWNSTTTECRNDACIHELFESQVKKMPDAVALECEEKSLTYGELNDSANQLAHYLRRVGVRSEQIVGICLERSIEMVISLLAILKADGAYLPLDSDYPNERLEFIQRDAEVEVIVTQEKLAGKFAGLQKAAANPRIIYLERDRQAIAQESHFNLRKKAQADNLAYVIYTSGSTGEPKGVCGLHRGAINRFSWMWREYPFVPNDKTCIKTSLSFVDSVWEVFGALLQGISSILIADDEVKDPLLFVRVLAARRVTRVVLVPSLLRTLLDYFPNLQKHLPELRYCCVSGEALPRDVALQFQRSLPNCALLNLYGATEASGDSTCFQVRTDNHVLIGRPIDNTRIYILDSHMQLVPVGVRGEIQIGGDGLARGYLKRPGLTAEKFILDPFTHDPNSRLFRTGDLARYRPDGNIEILGRADNQIKIRGYRIEPGEIETMLSRHPEIREAVVIARERESSIDKDLIAYIVPMRDSIPSVTDVRKFLTAKVPEYMIPSAFTILKALPLTRNGKVDRNALLLPERTRRNMPQAIEPRSELEELIIQIWREVLRLDGVGVFDDFFELGGHSLLATRIAARLRSSFSIDLPLRKVFELPTVAALAEHVQHLIDHQSGTKAPPIVPVNRHRRIPASFSQQRLWFINELYPESTAYNISCVFSVRGALDIPIIEEALNTIIARHEILRTTFDDVQGVLVQNIRPVLRIHLPVTHIQNLNHDARQSRVREIALEEARKPFDLRNGPLFRAKILKTDETSQYLLLNFDHTILDGSSMTTLFNELGTLYGALARKEPNPLTPLAIQYADYAVWQRQFFKDDAFGAQLAYWRRQFGSDFSLRGLSTDYPRPAVQTSRGVRKSLALSKQLTDSLKELSRREGVTVFMTLLAAFKILLSRYSGQEDVVVGATIAGRSRREIEGLIGFFVNALPLRTDVSGNPSFLALLKRVREVCLGAYTYQDLPFEKIVEAINPTRDPGRNPVFQIMFNMADVSDRVLQLTGCEVRKESFFDPEAKFDLTLYAPEQDGVIELAMVYNADLFSEARISIMLEQFRYLLSQIQEKPKAKIGEYSLLLPSTRSMLPDPTDSLDGTWKGAIYTYVAHWAEHEPDRVAVVGSTETWTYGEIEICSNQISSYLIAQGVHSRDVVALYAHRGPELVVALLGILKAGAVFVVLDPENPVTRLIAYLRIARPKGWIHLDASRNLASELATCLDTLKLSCRLNLPTDKQTLADFLSQRSEITTDVIVDAGDPAYIAFTSGTAGEPKGVLSRHGPITHFLPWQKEAFELSETDRFCLLSGLAYNHLHRDIFTALYLGATVNVPPPEIVREPKPLIDWLRTNGISVLHLTPAFGQLLLTAPQPLTAVRHVFFGGDVLTRGEVARIRELAPNATIGCFYGATETQRAVGYYEIPRDFTMPNSDVNRPVPLGQGIKDVQLLLLNESGQLAGVGELAELYVRSPHLAEGTSRTRRERTRCSS